MADLSDAPFLQTTPLQPAEAPEAPFAVPRKEPDMSRAKAMFEKNLANAPFKTGKEPTVMDAIEAGLQISVTGLLARGKAPDKILPEDLPFAQRIAGNVATLAGDLPWMTAGALLGGAAGSPTGPGAVVTSFAGAFALPAGLRATLMDAYEKGDFESAGDFFERFAGIMWETGKSWVVGAATGAAGVGAKAVLPITAPAAAKFAVPTAAEIVAMTAVGRALEGEMPKAQDFVDAAVIIFGAKAAVGGAAKLRAVYAKTGVKPTQVLEDVQKEPTVKQDLLSDRAIPEKYVEAYHGTPHEIGSEGFQISKIGSGEGAQAFGRGIYIAENSGVAKTYQRQVTEQHFIRKVQEIYNEFDSPLDASHALKNEASLSAREKALLVGLEKDDWLGFDYPHQAVQAILREPGNFLDISPETKSAADSFGNLYKVKVAQRTVDAMMDWDVPLEQQPTHIRTVLLAVAKETAISRGIGKDTVPDIMKSARQFQIDIEARLQNAGVPGIKYLDRSSRRTGSGSRNFVIFDPKNVTITHKNDKPLSSAEPTAESKEIAEELVPSTEPAARPADVAELTAPQQSVLARISKEPATKKSYTLSELYKDAKDEIYPLKEMVDELSGGKALPTAKDPYKLARLTRGSFGLAEQALEYGMFKWDTLQNVGKGLNEIIKPVEKDLDGLRAYLLSKHAIETETLGKTTGVPLDAAKKVVTEGGGKYENVSVELQQYLEGQLNWLVDSGIVAKDKAALWRSMYKAYIPLFRVMDTGEAGPKGAGRGLTVRQPIKGRVGSERIIVDPLESIIKNTYTFAQLADRNAVGQSLLALAQESGRTDLMQKVSAPPRPIEVEAREVAAFLKQFGMEGFAQEFTIFRRDALTPGRDEIAIYRNGVREVYKVPEAVADTFKATDRQSANMLVKILAVPARVLRAGAVLSPEFLARNPIRDQFTAYVLSKNGYVPLLDMVRGFVSIAKKDQDFQNWIKSGGANAAMVSIDRDYVQMQIAKRAGAIGYMDKTWNVVKSPIEGLQIISELMENATRIGEFKKALGGATTKEEIQRAGFESREVTVDFQRIGAKTRSMNLITAFWNANLEGMDRTVRGIRERPLETTTRIAASITLPSILLWWANHDDPRWKEIPNWQRDLFWIVMTKDHIYRIPKPFELGVIFGSSVERILDAYVADKPDAFKDFSSSVGNMIGVNMIPTIATPILGQITNYNLFTDRPVIPSSMERLLPEYQYMPYTTETAKALGHLIGTVPSLHDRSFASPMVIENYVRQWSGGLGMYALQIADAALRKTGVLPDPIRPASTLADIPFVKGFVVRYPSGSAQSIQDFYDRYTKASRVASSIRYLAQQGDVDAALRESRLDSSLLVRMEGLHQALANAHRLLMLIDKNQSFNSDEKRQLMDNIYTQMIQMANAGNDAARSIEKALGEDK